MPAIGNDNRANVLFEGVRCGLKLSRTNYWTKIVPHRFKVRWIARRKLEHAGNPWDVKTCAYISEYAAQVRGYFHFLIHPAQRHVGVLTSLDVQSGCTVASSFEVAAAT